MWTTDILPRNTEPTGLEVYTPEWIAYHAKAASIHDYCRYFVQLINSVPNVDAVLDIGCASGVLVDMLAKSGYSAMGQDVVHCAVDYARLHHRGKFVSCDLDTVSKYWKFDLVVLTHILEHLDDPKPLLDAARCLTRRYLLVSVPNLSSCGESGWRTSRKGAVLTHNHRVAYSPETIAEAVSSNGYRVLWVKTRTYPGTILTGLVVWVGRKLLTGKAPAIGDKALINPAVGVRLEEFFSAMPRTPFDRLAERNNRGDCVVLLAEKK